LRERITHHGDHIGRLGNLVGASEHAARALQHHIIRERVHAAALADNCHLVAFE
jgi:hypothetical protein